MHPPRLLVRTLMIVVAIVAIDFTAIRAIFTTALTFGVGLSALINTGLIGLALNIRAEGHAVQRPAVESGRPAWVGVTLRA